MKSRTGLIPALLAAILGIAVIWTANHVGFWWMTMLIGLAIGLLLRRTLTILVAAVLAAVGGWGLDLLWQSRQVDIGGAASIVAGILGLGQPSNGDFAGAAPGTPPFGASNGYLVILLTLALALLLALAGAWVGAALRQVSRAVQGIRSGTASPQESPANATEVAPVSPVDG